MNDQQEPRKDFPQDKPLKWRAVEYYSPGIGDIAGMIKTSTHLYCVPVHYHCNIVRYALGQPFEEASSWEVFNLLDSGVVNNPQGYFSGCCGKRYVYFSPWARADGSHGEFLCYDTTIPFDDPMGWVTHSPGFGEGFHGAVQLGIYIYYIPYRTGGIQAHGKVVRYNSLYQFNDQQAWSVFDAQAEIGAIGGYVGGFHDGRYLYFVPEASGLEKHNEVLRYDSYDGFNTATAWEKFSPALTAKGFRFGCYLNGYGYFANHQTNHVMRYGILMPFTENSSWEEHEVPYHFYGCFTAGTNKVHFVPHGGGKGMVYDDRLPFNPPTSNPGLQAWRKVGIQGSFCHGAADGDYGYYGPFLDGPGCKFQIG